MSVLSYHSDSRNYSNKGPDMRATSLCILFELRRNGDQLSMLRLIASLKIVHFQSKQHHKRTIARSTCKRLCDKVSRANQPGAQHKATQNEWISFANHGSPPFRTIPLTPNPTAPSFFLTPPIRCS